MEKLDGKKIIYLSGEGESGSWAEYTGERTEQAMKAFVTDEQAGGQRFCWLFVEQPDLADNANPEVTVYREYIPGEGYGNRLRTVPNEWIEE